MNRARGGWATTVLAAVIAAAPGCGPPPLDEVELLAHIEEFESLIAGQPGDIVEELLRGQAAAFTGRLVHVRSAIVASTYIRDNPSKIYFGTNYNESDHVFLSDVNPKMDASLEHHRHWVSIAATYPSRQLSYEIPIERATYERLEPGQEVSFSCRIAGLIRGKSVYCVPADILVVEK